MAKTQIYKNINPRVVWWTSHKTKHFECSQGEKYLMLISDVTNQHSVGI